MWVKPDKWMSPGEVADMLGISRGTVNGWRRRGMGPTYTKLGATIRYRIEDIESWVASNTIEPSESVKDSKKDIAA